MTSSVPAPTVLRLERWKWQLILTISLACLVPAVASAQQVLPPPPREGSAEFSFVGTTGNSTTQSIGMGGELIFRPDSWEFASKTAFIRNRSNSGLKAESLALTSRASHVLTPRVSLFGRYGYLHDQFAGITNRNSLDLGVSYVLISNTLHRLLADSGVGFARESRVVGLDLNTAVAQFGVTYILRFSKTAEISEDARPVISLSSIDDWRFANISSLSAKLTTKFSLKVSNTVRYVNKPTFGFASTDTITAVAFVAKF